MEKHFSHILVDHLTKFGLPLKTCRNDSLDSDLICSDDAIITETEKHELYKCIVWSLNLENKKTFKHYVNPPLQSLTAITGLLKDHESPNSHGL